jgi:hypothetical protein
MWLMSGPGFVVPVAPLPGTPPLAPVFLVPFPPVLGPFVGLEWDSVTGSLWAVDVGGFTYNFTPAGVPILGPIPPPPGFAPPAGDVAIDRTLRLNPSGFRPLYVNDGGGVIWDVNDIFAVAYPPFPAGVGPVEGLSFINHLTTQMPLAPPCPCPAGGGFPGFPGPLPPWSTGPTTAGNLAFGISTGGIFPAGFPVIFAFDVGGAFLPPPPILINTIGCPMGLFLGSPSLLLLLGGAGVGGVATFPVPLVPPNFLVGTGPIEVQMASLCPADAALGLVFSPMHTFYSAAP